MRSSSAEVRVPDGPREPVLGRRTRAVLTAALVGVAVAGPAVGIASARFGAADDVTISITVTRTAPDPVPSTSSASASPSAAGTGSAPPADSPDGSRGGAPGQP